VLVCPTTSPSCRTQARASVRVSLAAAPWYGFYPGFALALLLFALNFLADALREVLVPPRMNIKS